MTMRFRTQGGADWSEAAVTHVWPEGMFVESTAPLPVGTKLTFEIGEDQQEIEGSGRVVWRREARAAGPGLRPGMAIDFLDLGEDARLALWSIAPADSGGARRKGSGRATIKMGSQYPGPGSRPPSNRPTLKGSTAGKPGPRGEWEEANTAPYPAPPTGTRENDSKAHSRPTTPAPPAADARAGASGENGQSGTHASGGRNTQPGPGTAATATSDSPPSSASNPATSSARSDAPTPEVGTGRPRGMNPIRRNTPVGGFGAPEPLAPRTTVGTGEDPRTRNGAPGGAGGDAFAPVSTRPVLGVSTAPPAAGPSGESGATGDVFAAEATRPVQALLENAARDMRNVAAPGGGPLGIGPGMPPFEHSAPLPLERMKERAKAAGDARDADSPFAAASASPASAAGDAAPSSQIPDEPRGSHGSEGDDGEDGPTVAVRPRPVAYVAEERPPSRSKGSGFGLLVGAVAIGVIGLTTYFGALDGRRPHSDALSDGDPNPGSGSSPTGSDNASGNRGAKAGLAAPNPTTNDGRPGNPTAATAAQPENRVRVRIESTPAGAEVSIAGDVLGTTPVDLQLPAGQPVTVAVTAAGRAPAQRDIVPRSNSPTVRFALPALAFALEVTTTPPGARVAARGQATTTPGTLQLGMVSAAISVQIIKRGYHPLRREVPLDRFTLTDGIMRASMHLNLTSRRDPAPPPEEVPPPTPDPATSGPNTQPEDPPEPILFDTPQSGPATSPGPRTNLGTPDNPYAPAGEDDVGDGTSGAGAGEQAGESTPP